MTDKVRSAISDHKQMTNDVQQHVLTPRITELTGNGCGWKALVVAVHPKLGKRFFIATGRDVEMFLGPEWKVKAY